MVVATALTLATRQAWLVVAGFALLGITGAGVFPTGFIVVGRVAPGAMGLVSGVLFALCYLAWAISSPIVGGIADALSLRVALSLLGICGALIALCGLRLPRGQAMAWPHRAMPVTEESPTR
jgi:MFS family permease